MFSYLFSLSVVLACITLEMEKKMHSTSFFLFFVFLFAQLKNAIDNVQIEIFRWSTMKKKSENLLLPARTVYTCKFLTVIQLKKREGEKKKKS